MRPNQQRTEMRDRPEETHHPVIRRVLVDVMRMSDLLHAPVVEHDDLVSDFHRFFLVMRDDDRRHVHLVVQPA